MIIQWKPQPKQAIALSRTEDEILYGGARGGGKTDAGLAWLMYDIDKPQYRALVIRKNYTDLSDWLDRAQKFYFNAGGKLVGDTITFPSGARIKTGHLADKDAYQKYQGHEYQKILIEELTHISRESDYEKLRASNRSTVKGIQSQTFCTTNPDGAGHEWVKERWNIPERPTDTVITRDPESDLTRAFIPSTLDDNPILMENDPKYVKMIESIKDPELRRAWREGSWEGFGVEGAYYKVQLDKARAEGRIRIGLFDPTQPVYTWCDIGKGENYAMLFMQKRINSWAVIDYEELKDNEGLHDGLKLLKQKPYIYAEHYAPHDMAIKDFSATRSRKDIASDNGIEYQILPQSSVHEGIDIVKFRFASLWFEDNPNVQKFLKRIARYTKEWDESRGVWKTNPRHDENSHGADTLRYWAVTDVQDFNDMMAMQVSQNRMRDRGFR